MLLSVIIPTHRPNALRLRRTLEALARQQFPADQWELLLVDNASPEPIALPESAQGPMPRLVHEPRLGLAHARARGFSEARGEAIILVDDDNVLDPHFLSEALAALKRLPGVGVFGGPSVPEFELQPEPWQQEFFSLLALRDLGPSEIVSHGFRPPGSSYNIYPEYAPIGAGMVLRREVATAWLARPDSLRPSDRRGSELSSGGDNDIVMSALEKHWEVAYVPSLRLTHLIPSSRLTPDYLARLNHGIRKSWPQVLALHEACPWAPIPAWTLPLRCGRAWFRHRAWSSQAAQIRWRGTCGHFEGLALLRGSRQFPLDPS